jgi:tripartite-type tricarboxylate transporter receptor subunit TctC
MRLSCTLAAASAAGALLAAITVAGGAAAQDYKGKQIKVIVGFSPGGGYDAYGRLLARHFGPFIPGKPSVIVQNMPGASSMKAVKFLDAGAPQDGTAMTIFNPGLITQSMTNPKKVSVDFMKLRFVGSASSDIRLCYYWHATGIKTLDDVFKRPQIVMGATAIGSSSYINGALLRNMFGAKIKHVLGYPGSAEQRIAIERGELDGDCGAWGSTPGNWIKNKQINPVVRFSKVSAPDMPDMPHVMDIAKTPEQKQILSLILAPSEIGRPFVMSAKVPAERLAALRKAFMEMVKDKAFLAEADKGKREIIGPMSGEEAEAAIKAIYATPRDVIAKVGDMIK